MGEGNGKIRNWYDCISEYIFSSISAGSSRKYKVSYLSQVVSEDEPYIDVDTPDLFPEECLIHEDCPQDSFCSPQPDNTYVRTMYTVYYREYCIQCTE